MKMSLKRKWIAKGKMPRIFFDVWLALLEPVVPLSLPERERGSDL